MLSILLESARYIPDHIFSMSVLKKDVTEPGC